MLFLNGQPFYPMFMDKAGDDGGSGGGGGGPGDDGGKPPGPGGKGDKPPAGGGQGGNDGGNPDDLPEDESKWTPEQTKAYIQKLRKENGSYRTRFKDAEAKTAGLEDRFGKLEKGLKSLAGGDDDGKSETLEEKIARLEKRDSDREEAQAIEKMNRAVEDTADALSVPKEGLDYFKFLIQQKAEKMKDDEVIPEDVLAELAKKAISQTKASGKGTTTSVDGGKDGDPPKPEGKPSGITAAQFAKMTVAEKSALYQNNKDEYEKLMQECKTQKLLFT